MTATLGAVIVAIAGASADGQTFLGDALVLVSVVAAALYGVVTARSLFAPSATRRSPWPSSCGPWR